MLAGNIRASHTQLARVVLHNDKPHLIDLEQFTNKEFSDFHSVISLYLRKYKLQGEVACIGAAGPLLSDSISVTNLPWKIRREEIQDLYHIKQVKLINDLEATAHGITHLSEDKFFTINPGKKIDHGNMGIIAPGSGLGECLMFFNGTSFCPIASEGGHGVFAPGSKLEAELWETLYDEQGIVEVEDIVSRPGLVRIYQFLADRQNATYADWFVKAEDKPAKLLEIALSGTDKLAVQTLDLFIDCFASETANLALKGMTLGGIYLAGTVASQLMMTLEKGRFLERFVHKGKLEKILTNIPVDVVIDDTTAVLGAGAVALKMV